MPARAKLPPGGGKRVPLNMRTTKEIREKLETEAARSGRSLTQEVEARIERSLIDDLGSEPTRKLMRALALAKEMTEMTTGKDVFSDQETAEAARTAMVAILDALLPMKSLAAKDNIEPSEGQDMVLADPLSRSLGDNIRDAILEGLGPNLKAIKKNLKKKS